MLKTRRGREECAMRKRSAQSARAHFMPLAGALVLIASNAFAQNARAECLSLAAETPHASRKTSTAQYAFRHGVEDRCHPRPALKVLGRPEANNEEKPIR